jgi:hypothetical protein
MFFNHPTILIFEDSIFFYRPCYGVYRIGIPTTSRVDLIGPLAPNGANGCA